MEIKKLKPKRKKSSRKGDKSQRTCPNCLSKLEKNETGKYNCTGDKLSFWDKEFSTFHKYSSDKKIKKLDNPSTSSVFLELYDNWLYCKENNEIFECGLTNDIYPLINSSKISIPDPMFCKKIEDHIGRKLNEEELLGETELYFYQGKFLTQYKKGATLINIPYIVLPSEETIYI